MEAEHPKGEMMAFFRSTRFTAEPAGVLIDQDGWYYEETKHPDDHHQTIRIRQRFPLRNRSQLDVDEYLAGLNHPMQIESTKAFFSGSYRWLEIQREPHNHIDPNAIAVYGTFYDVTNVKRHLKIGYVNKAAARKLKDADISELFAEMYYIQGADYSEDRPVFRVGIHLVTGEPISRPVAPSPDITAPMPPETDRAAKRAPVRTVRPTPAPAVTMKASPPHTPSRWYRSPIVIVGGGFLVLCFAFMFFAIISEIFNSIRPGSDTPATAQHLEPQQLSAPTTPKEKAPAQTNLRASTENNLYMISAAMTLYQMEYGIYPPASSIKTLESELTPKFAESIPATDAWGHALEVTSTRSTFTIRSLGPDGQESDDDLIMTDEGIRE